MTTRLLLIRHAESTWSPDDDRPLSDAGLRAADRLVRQLGDYPISAVFTSPHRRAIQTVTPLAVARGLELTPVPELREREMGDLLGTEFDAAMRRSWADSDAAWPGGESAAEAQRRVRDQVMRLVAESRSSSVALATHGQLLALLLNAFDPSVGYDFWRALTFPDLFDLRITNAESATYARIELLS